MLELTTILELVGTLGISGVFLALYLIERKAREKRTDQVITMGQQTATLAAQATEALTGTTQALDRLAGRIDDWMRSPK